MLRLSRYCVHIEDSDGTHLLYDTANGAFVALDEESWTSCRDGEGRPAGLEEELSKRGILTSLSPEEELALVHGRFERRRHAHDELSLSIAPTYSCNFRCPYCYEVARHGLSGHMDGRVQDAVVSFVSEQHRRTGFEHLSVQWYGGEPSLALDVVEELSDMLIAWCVDAGVSYEAMILTNCSRIDDAAASMLAAHQVSSALATIDGIGATNDVRRRSVDGSSTYEAIFSGIRALADQGIAVRATMNIDRVNWPEYPALKDLLERECGVNLGFAQTCDYMHTFGTEGFCSPTFDLFDQDEFARLSHDEFVKENPSASALRAALAPHSVFCNGQRDDYFIIDYRGDVYLCDERIGEPGQVAFNVLDERIAPESLALISHDPLDDADCAACELLPLCQGNCIWERTLLTSHCHPFKTTLPAYLHDYRAALGAPTTGKGCTVLAEPFDEEQLSAL